MESRGKSVDCQLPLSVSEDHLFLHRGRSEWVKEAELWDPASPVRGDWTGRTGCGAEVCVITERFQCLTVAVQRAPKVIHH